MSNEFLSIDCYRGMLGQVMYSNNYSFSNALKSIITHPHIF